MRSLIGAMFVLAACSQPSPTPVAHEARATAAAPSIDDLEFKDPQLQIIATHLREQARLRGIVTSPGTNRIERLLSLEIALRGDSGVAFQRVNKLVSDMTMTDASQWAKLRQRAEREFRKGNDDTAGRVRDLLVRWQQRKSDIVFRYLSSNYDSTWIRSMEWERRFHDFVTERPLDAATWGWLLLREHANDARQQYGRADAESAYRFYLEFSGLGDGRESRRIFSVPGIEIAAR